MHRLRLTSSKVIRPNQLTIYLLVPCGEHDLAGLSRREEADAAERRRRFLANLRSMSASNDHSSCLLGAGATGEWMCRNCTAGPGSPYARPREEH